MTARPGTSVGRVVVRACRRNPVSACSVQGHWCQGFSQRPDNGIGRIGHPCNGCIIESCRKRSKRTRHGWTRMDAEGRRSRGSASRVGGLREKDLPRQESTRWDGTGAFPPLADRDPFLDPSPVPVDSWQTGIPFPRVLPLFLVPVRSANICGNLRLGSSALSPFSKGPRAGFRGQGRPGGQTGKRSVWQTERPADSQTGRRSDWQAVSLADGKTGRQSDWQTVRLAEGQTGKRSDRPTERPEAVRLAEGQTGRQSCWPTVMLVEGQKNLKVAPPVRVVMR